MTTSTTEIRVPEAMDVTVTEDALTVELSDGRTPSVPLAWFPRLTHATAEERSRWRLIGRGDGIHWTDLDEWRAFLPADRPARASDPWNTGWTVVVTPHCSQAYQSDEGCACISGRRGGISLRLRVA